MKRRGFLAGLFGAAAVAPVLAATVVPDEPGVPGPPDEVIFAGPSGVQVMQFCRLTDHPGRIHVAIPGADTMEFVPRADGTPGYMYVGPA